MGKFFFEIGKIRVLYNKKDMDFEYITKNCSQSFKNGFNVIANEIFKWYDYKTSKNIISTIDFSVTNSGFYCSVNVKKENFIGQNRLTSLLSRIHQLKAHYIIPDKFKNKFRLFLSKNPYVKILKKELFLPPFFFKFPNIDEYVDLVKECRNRISETNFKNRYLAVDNSYYLIESINLYDYFDKIFIIEKNPKKINCLEHILKKNKLDKIIIYKGNLHSFLRNAPFEKVDLLLNCFGDYSKIDKLPKNKINEIHKIRDKQY